ncbi:uncharacterized protein B0I36DRAFT_107055 [Microdochium trichocladiopsis]|uniref:Uncharacterized protein n=1 Tax=Microdochium trichocladiopsis TaxID=1682393 RepID=A0A9P9BRX8_9PEZI|nr:uncharacterized protein B0I36DRAFT_107055 [Microdochium trichocladiopsis]KAH7033280.1 hypothetical protein B0I36DRAFT_107055 [Microdochium trichocladiopsis]
MSAAPWDGDACCESEIVLCLASAKSKRRPRAQRALIIAPLSFGVMTPSRHWLRGQHPHDVRAIAVHYEADAYIPDNLHTWFKSVRLRSCSCCCRNRKLTNHIQWAQARYILLRVAFLLTKSQMPSLRCSNHDLTRAVHAPERIHHRPRGSQTMPCRARYGLRSANGTQLEKENWGRYRSVPFADFEG